MAMFRFRWRRHKDLPRFVSPRAWALWSAPRHLIAYALITEMAAIVATVLLVIRFSPTSSDFVEGAILVGLGVVNAEISRHVERMRRRFSDTPHVNLTSVWTVAAALILSPGMSAAVVVVLYVHLWLRSWYRVHGVHAYRLTFSAATIVLACHAASAVQLVVGPREVVEVVYPGALWGIPLVVAAFATVNTGLIAGAIAWSERTLKPERILGSWPANALELATICLGVLAASLLDWKPVLVLLFVPALHVLHRSLLVRQFQLEAAIDSKTGLYTMATWHGLVAKEFERAQREGTSLGVLMVDLDHFKVVNDHYGHLAGDHVLRAVADALRQEVRRDDIVGRFGGEEFVIALPEVEGDDLAHVGERICARIRNLRVAVDGVEKASPIWIEKLTVSIGAASYPASAEVVDEVLLAADNALFSAKDAGRDQVVSQRPHPVRVNRR